MELKAEWIFKSDPIDIAKLSPETRLKVIRFADVAPKYRLSKRIVWDTLPDGTPVFAEVYPDRLQADYFSARQDLFSIPEEQVKFFVDQLDIGKRMDKLQDRGATEAECNIDHEEMLGFEAELIELGERIMRTPKLPS
jgi:hypothetical protein